MTARRNRWESYCGSGAGDPLGPVAGVVETGGHLGSQIFIGVADPPCTRMKGMDETTLIRIGDRGSGHCDRSASRFAGEALHSQFHNASVLELRPEGDAGSNQGPAQRHGNRSSLYVGASSKGRSEGLAAATSDPLRGTQVGVVDVVQLVRVRDDYCRWDRDVLRRSGPERLGPRDADLHGLPGLRPAHVRGARQDRQWKRARLLRSVLRVGERVGSQGCRLPSGSVI